MDLDDLESLLPATDNAEVFPPGGDNDDLFTPVADFGVPGGDIGGAQPGSFSSDTVCDAKGVSEPASALAR